MHWIDSLLFQLMLEGKISFAEVQYFFRMHVNEELEARNMAIVSLYTPPDLTLLAASYNTVWSCKYQGSQGFRVVDVKSILSVVAIIPYDHHALETSSYFVVEKFGLDMWYMGGSIEEDLEYP